MGRVSMALPLDENTRSIIKACIPALEVHGLAITTEMYRRLLIDPDIRSYFNLSHQADGSQARALAGAVLAYARHIDDPGVLGAAIERIAEKHVGLTVQPDHYPLVGTALLGAIGEVLGDAATPEILEAWGHAYWFLADILIAREAEISASHGAMRGGWTGWRSFFVKKRIVECADVISFVLAPVDGQPVMRHLPGQFLSFRFHVPGRDAQSRNYSISSAPDDEAYRISVRRIPGGLVSNWLHDEAKEGTTLDVSAPAGDFILTGPAGAPVVLISGGIGATPMIAMLDTLLGCPQKPAVQYIHCDANRDRDAFARHIQHLGGHEQMTADLFYTRSTSAAGPRAAQTHIHDGRIPMDWLAGTVDPDATCYICGPDDFMRETVDTLRAAGIPPSRIRYEYFGSGDDLT
jgi:nitric oxide dioxygenase